MSKWQKWYAWYPVFPFNDRPIWLRHVMRRKTFIPMTSICVTEFAFVQDRQEQE